MTDATATSRPVTNPLTSGTEREAHRAVELDLEARAVMRTGAPRLDEPDVGSHTRAFHRRLPNYEVTPLRRCPALASSLGVGEIWVKDESRRLGLPAFKILGTSYGVYRLLVQRAGEEPTWDTLDDLRRWAANRLGPLTLCAATDGNHGRAVAHLAALLGFRATIYVPDNMSHARIESMQREGAEIHSVDGDYDDAVRRAAEEASARCLVVSDTSWPGYTEVPTWVMDGYATVFSEVREQLGAAPSDGRCSETTLDLVVVPAGVGAFLGSALRSLKGSDAVALPAVVSVEPTTADCVARSLEAATLVHVPGPHRSIMVGLNCGTPSQVAWPRIARALDGALCIGDGWAVRAMRDLAAAGIVAGETGAASLAGLTALCRSPALSAAKAALGLGPRSRVLLVCTEGATDPGHYREIVGVSPEAGASPAAGT